MRLNLSIYEGQFTIHRLSPNTKIPDTIYESSFYSISKTTDELSIVCSSAIHLDSERAETGWSCIKIIGPLDFALTGILADILAILATEKISIFTLSTFDTDYILIKADKVKAAKTALQKAEYIFKNESRTSRYSG
jgi:hypothetical protein